jgi:hypothetical protein
VGFAILLTPKNQAGSGGNLCPICQVTDVTIRYDSISHVGAGLQIANALAATGAAFDGQRYSIHDIVIDDIDGVKYNGPGVFAQVSVSVGAPLLQNVTINHVTAFPSSMLFMIGDQVATTTQMKNFIFTNSIVNAGTAPVWSTGGGPSSVASAMNHDQSADGFAVVAEQRQLRSLLPQHLPNLAGLTATTSASSIMNVSCR